MNGPTGVQEQGRGMGWIDQEPVRSCVLPVEKAIGSEAERDQVHGKASVPWKRIKGATTGIWE